MKKKLIGLAMLITLLAMQVMGVSAASKTTKMALTGKAISYYELRDMNEDILKGLDADVADLIRQVNDGKKTLDDIAKAQPEIAGELEGKTLITPIMDLIPINGGIKTADGKEYIVQNISVPALTKGCSDVKVLHYSTERKVWEVITPNAVNLDTKEIDVNFTDLSPIAVIAKVDASQSVVGTAPKTGVESTWGVWAISAVVLMAAAVLTFRRKRV